MPLDKQTLRRYDVEPLSGEKTDKNTENGGCHMEHVKAAIFDVDGTLFDYREMKIRETTVQAIRALKARGAVIIVATSRSYPELSEELLSRICADFYVCAGGNSIQDAEGRVLYATRFTHAQTERMKALALEHDLGLTLKYEDCSCLYRHPVQMQAIYENIGPARCPTVYCPAMDAHHTRLPIGFTVRGEGDRRDRVCDLLEESPGDFRVERFGNGIVADVFPPQSNKKNALDYLTCQLGILPGQCIAFGDGRNDLEMLRWAGTGVAMGNACAELKAAADEVCGASWDDGIARFLMARI